MTKKLITEAEPDNKTAATPKFSVSRLREKCYDIFGVTTSTFDGATYGLSGEYTVEEMKDKIKIWQKKEVN